MRWSRGIHALVVALLAVTPYLPSIRYPFVFDDLHLIVNNGFLREPWSPLTAFAHHFWYGTPFGAAYYRPLVTASLALNGRIAGWEPAGFHLFNILLHAANAVLVLLLARRLGQGDRAALLAAALFAVHPATAWAVGSIVARVDLLPAFFLLLAALQLAAVLQSSASGAWRSAAVGVFFLLALFCKESAVAFLVVPLLLAFRTQRNESCGKPRWPVLIALGLAVMAYLAARRAVGLGIVMDKALVDPLINPLGTLPFPARFWAAAGLSGRYILYLFFPAGFGDPHNYLDPAALPGPLDPAGIASLLVLLAWLGAIAALWLRRDRLCLPLAFALGSFLPASNLIVPIASLYAENFLYLPLLGISLAVGELLQRWRLATSRSGPSRFPSWRVGSAFLILAGLAMAARLEIGIWKDGTTLFANLTRRFPFYPPAHSVLGVTLLEQGRPDEAIPPLRRAVALADNSFEGHYNLGVALLLTAKERGPREEALQHLRRASELRPRTPLPHVQASRVLLLLDRAQEAEIEARQALQLDGTFSPAIRYLAESLSKQGRSAEADDLYRQLNENALPPWR